MNHERWMDWLEKVEACGPAQRWVRENKYNLKQSWDHCCQSGWLAWLLSEVAVNSLRPIAKKAVRMSYEIANTILRKIRNPPKEVVDGMYVIYRLLSGDRVSIQYLRVLRQYLVMMHGEIIDRLGEIIDWLYGVFTWMIKESTRGERYLEYMTYGAMENIGDLMRVDRGLSDHFVYNHDDYDEVSLELCEIIRANFGCPTTDSLRRAS